MASVIINDVLPRTQATATASQTVFDTTWSANVETDIKVYARATGVDADDYTQVVSSTDYNVTFIGAENIVRVTFLSGRTSGDVITIIRDTPTDRLNLYTNTNFTSSMLNSDFGTLVYNIQQSNLDRGSEQGVGVRYNYSEDVTLPKDQILPILSANSLWIKNAGDSAITTILARDALAAPYDAKFYLAEADSAIPNAKNLGALTPGLLKHSVTSSISTPARAIPHTDYSIEEAPTTTGVADAYLVTVDSDVTAYHTGMIVTAKIHTSNSGPSTINVNGIGVKNIKLADNSDPVALDLLAGAIDILIYDGTNFQLITPQFSTSAGGLSSTLTDANIFVGNGSNIATGVAMSGDATMANTGAMTIADDAISTAKIADNAVTLGKMASGTAGELITYSDAGDPATVAAGTAGQVLTSNGAGAAPTMQDSASGGKSSYDVSQVGHGLAVNDVIKYDGSTTYSKATADSAANAEVIGIVTAVADVDNFTVQTSGRVTTLTGLTDDQVYFLSPTTAGLLTTTEPTTDGQISRPVLISTSTTEGVILPYRGVEVNNTSANTTYDLPFIAGFDSTMVKEFVAVQVYGQMVMARTGTFTGEAGYADTAPTGADIILDVKKNGTSIYSTLPEFAAGSQTLTAGVLKTDGTEDYVPADRISFEITQIGSTEPGRGVRFTVTSEETV